MLKANQPNKIQSRDPVESDSESDVSNCEVDVEMVNDNYGQLVSLQIQKHTDEDASPKAEVVSQRKALPQSIFRQRLPGKKVQELNPVTAMLCETSKEQNS